jgi:biotin transport system ATP-binding protein
MIEIRNVSHRYGDREVLRGVDLTLSERRIAVVGGNGSGKSTFARLLNGLHVPTQGQVLVDGLDTRTQGREVRRRVGFVFQNPDNQIVLPMVEEDLAFGLRNIGVGKGEIRAKVDAVLARYGLEGHRRHPAHLLSGGQKQLLAISGVLVMDPRYVVFDEPTTLLDLRNKRRVAEAIRDLDQTAIVVSHDLDLLADFERVIVFDEGRVAIDDAPSRALARYVDAMA